MDYTYESLLTDLKIGREIEFEYKASRYSITRTNGCWNFTTFNQEDYLQIKNLDDIGLVKVEDCLLKDLFDLGKYQDLTIF